MRFILTAVACVGLCFGVAADEELNDLMVLRSKIMIEAHQLQMDVRQTWNDPAYTSPEIEALRKTLEDLQEALLRTQGEIKEKVEALPEVQVKVKKMEEANKKVEELNQKIEAKTGEEQTRKEPQ